MDGYIIILLSLLSVALALGLKRLVSKADTLLDNQEKESARQQEILEELKKMNRFLNTK